MIFLFLISRYHRILIKKRFGWNCGVLKLLFVLVLVFWMTLKRLITT